MIEPRKNLKYYLRLPYTTVLRRDEDGDVVAHVTELPGCSEHGATPPEALENLEAAKHLWISESLKARLPIPEPELPDDLPSGKWVQRVPRTLHKRLAEVAQREAVSLNQLVTSMLAEALAMKSLTMPRAGHRGLLRRGG
jgi:antitoxin HicB